MTGMQVVLASLRGQLLALTPELDDAAVREALGLAEAHHVLPMALAGMPDAVRRARWPEVRLQGFWWTCELRGLIAGFSAAGVAMMPLKGPAFAERAYGAAELRPCRDLDLLVKPHDVQAAEKVLTGLGFAPLDDGDDYHRTWLRGATAVELHRGVAIPGSFHFDLAAAWERAERGTFAGVEILQLRPEDELIYLCLHAARHRFDRLSMVLDVQRALERCCGTVGGGTVTPELIKLAASQRLEGALWVGGGLAARLSGQDFQLPPAFAALVAELWEELSQGPPRPYDTPELYRFWMRLEQDRVGRMRRQGDHLRIAATRLIEDDYEIARKAGVGRQHKQLVRVLRLVRLLSRYLGK